MSEKRPTDEPEPHAKRIAPVAPIERMCCGECGRKYATPLDLPPVVITAITKVVPDKVERVRETCYTCHNGWTVSDWFMARLSPASQADVRSVDTKLVTSEKRVAVTTTNGEAGTCVIKPWKFADDEPAARLDLYVDVSVRVSPAIHASGAANPFVVAPEPVNVRNIWGVSLDQMRFVESRFLWLHRLQGYYLGICKLQFDTTTTGHFELALIDDGPNMGSAGGPTVEYLAPLYRVDFMFPPTHGPVDD